MRGASCDGVKSQRYLETVRRIDAGRKAIAAAARDSTRGEMHHKIGRSRRGRSPICNSLPGRVDDDIGMFREYAARELNVDLRVGLAIECHESQRPPADAASRVHPVSPRVQPV